MFNSYKNGLLKCSYLFLHAIVVVMVSLGCSRDPERQVGDNASDNLQSDDGDGAVDNYDYSGSVGWFNDEGVWEQPKEFCAPPPFPAGNSCDGESGKLGKALQMALWFFNVNKSGENVYCTDVQWRGDAHLSDAHIKLKSGAPDGVNMSDAFIAEHIDVLDPDGDGEVDVSGGYYDAGDYIKFAMTTGYMASTIAWAMYEFPESFRLTSLEDEALTQIRWAADYFMKNTFIENHSNSPDYGKVIAYAHQVGAAVDHECGWMPPELRDPSFCPRQAFFATTDDPASDVTANNAAALALVSLVTKSDAEYSQKALNYAIALYEFAVAGGGAIQSTTGGLYNSEYAWDDLAWAAVWLYEATGDWNYLEKALGHLYDIPGFDKTCVLSLVDWNSASETNACWAEGWTHIWNSLRSGVFVRMAVSLSEAASANDASLDSLWEQSDDDSYQLTNSLTEREYLQRLGKLFRYITRADSMAWRNSAQTPGGFSTKVNVTWGSGRYNSAGQLVALVYARNFEDDSSDSAPAELVDWAFSQTQYLLGKNEVNEDPEGKSFVMGYTEYSPNYANQPHHAAGHASIYGLPDNPTENRHIIWGALVNGPVGGEDVHIDQRGDYGSNEITIDYNAALVGALAGNYYFQREATDEEGLVAGCPDPDFPPIEDPIDEFYTMGKINSANDCRSQVDITMMNESIHPPRYNEFLTARYYIDVTELEMAGIDPSTMTATINYDRSAGEWGEPTGISGPFKCEDEESEEAKNMWYFVLSYEGYKFWGRQTLLKGPRVTQVDFGIPNGDSCVWDPTNDWSYDSLNTDEEIKTPHITAYGEDNKLLWGEEPPCHPIQHVLVDVVAE
ncbi:MAG: glycoside hydrolase family 9 protein [Deltaproteobacteria bacterium]|nr:glycoside hydrolase family 9 protein [Deltaproteobacteria bacterium]MBN2671846.1 glycoside hydrolase family 9 protein [Deltaproteobacteria bacterium]